MPTPDPSAIPVNVYVAGMSGDPADFVRLLVVVGILGFGLVILTTATLTTLLVRRF